MALVFTLIAHAPLFRDAAHGVHAVLAAVPAAIVGARRARAGRGSATPVDDGFAARLKLAMGEAGVGNPEVARVAGVHRFTVTFWRSGKQRPHRLAIAGIARALGVRAAWLRTGEGPMRPAERSAVRTTSREPECRRFIQRELAAYADAGVPAAEIDAVACLFRTPEVHPLYLGASAILAADSDPITTLRVLAGHARTMLRTRSYAVPADPGD